MLFRSLAVACGTAGGGAAFRSGERGRIEVYDLDSRKLRWTQGAHSTAALAVAFSPNGKEIASVGNGNALILWDAYTGQQRRTIPLEGDKHTAVLYLPKGDTIVTTEEERKVAFWNLQTGKRVRQREGHNASIRTLSLSPNGEVLASGSLDGVIRLWHLNQQP